MIRQTLKQIFKFSLRYGQTTVFQTTNLTRITFTYQYPRFQRVMRMRRQQTVLTFHNQTVKKIRTKKIKNGFIFQAQRILQIKKKTIERIMRIRFRTRTFTNRQMIYQTFRFKRRFKRMKQKFVIRISEIIKKFQMTKSFRRLQYHTKIMTT